MRTVAVRLATDQQLPDILWVAVLGGSVVVLALCLTCGVRDGVLRRVLLVGVTAVVGINLFLVVDLNYPFYGSIRIHPTATRASWPRLGVDVGRSTPGPAIAGLRWLTELVVPHPLSPGCLAANAAPAVD